MKRQPLFRKHVAFFVFLVSKATIWSGLRQLYFSYQENQRAPLNTQREKAGRAVSSWARKRHRAFWSAAPHSPSDWYVGLL